MSTRDLPVVRLCCCARCSGDLHLDPSQVDHLGMSPEVYCRKCQAILDAEQAAAMVAPGVRCVHRCYASGPFSQLVVKSVEGDQVTVFLLGWPDPDDPAELIRRETMLARWWPGVMRGRREFARSELLMKGI